MGLKMTNLTAKLLPLVIYFSLAPVFAAVEKPAAQIELKNGKSRVEFTALGSSGLTITGKTSDDHPVTGNFKVDGKKVSGTARLELEGLDTGMEMRNKHMKEKYLEVPKFPEAKFTLTELTLPGDPTADFLAKQIPFKGEMLLHGQTKPVTGFVDAEKKGTDLNLEFTFALKMGQFQIQTPSFLGITVAEDVNVLVQAKSPLVVKN